MEQRDATLVGFGLSELEQRAELEARCITRVTSLKVDIYTVAY